MASTTVIKSIGRFQMKEVMGSGGLATMYRAHDSSRGSEVALKVLHAYFTRDQEALDRLKGQLELILSFRHPNLVTVYEYGEDSGHPWIAEEYVPHKTLRDLVDGPIRVDMALKIALQLADVLEEAHKRGLLHGDIKPSNVFVSEQGHVKLSDFGMARLASALPFAMRMGMSTPMPSFMSPEQASGGELTESTDVYSLGVLLYWLLTGEIPFYGNSSETVYAKQMRYRAPAPSTLNPQLPSELDQALLKALAPFEAIRYRSISEFKGDLSRALEGLEDRGSMTGDAGLLFGGRDASAAYGARAAGILEDGAAETDVSRRGLLFDRIWSLHYIPPKKRRRILWGTAIVLAVLFSGSWSYRYVKANVSFLPPPASAVTLNEAPGQWASYRKDLLNTGYVADTPLPIEGRVKWALKTEQAFFSSPALSEGKLFVSTGDRRIISMDADSGKVVWEYQTTGPVDSSPMVSGGLVYFGLRDKRVVAIRADTGKEVWDFFTGNPILAPPSVKDGVLYIGSGDGALYALDAATGSLRWSFPTRGWVVSAPALTEDSVIIASQDGWLYTLRPSTGAKMFSYFTGGAVTSAPAVHEDKIYVTNKTGRIWAVAEGERDLFLDKERQIVHAQFYIWGIASPPSPQKGTVWGQRKAKQVFTSPAVGQGTVVVGSDSGNVYAWDAEDGSPRWEYKAGGPVQSSPSIAGNTVYFGADDGKLYALDLSTGERLWDLQLGGKVRSSPAIGSGVLYVTAEDGVLYAID